MDIPRSKANQTARRVRLALITLAASSAAVLLALGLGKLGPAPPTVDRSTVWIDTVRRGTLIRQVRGLGTLLPVQISWIPATTEGRVEKIYVRPGARVKADTVLVLLSNPEVQQTALEAGLQLKAAEAEYTNLRVQLASQLMGQRAALATVQSEYRQAVLQGAANEELASKGLIPRLQAQLSKVKIEELGSRRTIEQQRLAIAADAIRAQLAVQTSKIEQLRTLLELRNSRVDSLKVRAGIAGVLQQLPLDIGQRVMPGTNLARVADPRTLKAELKIAETQAKDIQLGQSASVDTHNGAIKGAVARIDPAVQNGTVTVDVRLTGSLPAGARPDLSVDGTIELERLTNVLYVGRPAFGQENQTVGLFKLDSGASEATRVAVRLGKSSVNTIEILTGLRAGERVILSDMSAQESYNRIRLQ